MTPSTNMHATTSAVAAAHDGHRDRALAGVAWQRRGLLGRLVRTELPAEPAPVLAEPARRAA
jgi:hypothetical protein